MSWTFMQSFSFIPLMASRKKIFEYFFENLAFRLPGQPIKISDFDKFMWLVKYYSRNISVKLLSKYLQ